MAFCCWIGSIDPHAELKPSCGCLGWRDYAGKNRAALRTARTVRSWIIELVRDAKEKHGLLLILNSLPNIIEVANARAVDMRDHHASH